LSRKKCIYKNILNYFKTERRGSTLAWGGEGGEGVSWKSNLAGRDHAGRPADCYFLDVLYIINLMGLFITLESDID
jgi:hypothetical protein